MEEAEGSTNGAGSGRPGQKGQEGGAALRSYPEGSRGAPARPDPPGGDIGPQVVLVTGAGGPAGISVLLDLRRAGHGTVAADASADATGLRLADGAGVLPLAGDHSFLDALCDLGAAHGATAVIATVAEEVIALAEGADRLAAAGLATWVPEAKAVRTCIDKWLFHQAAEAAGVAVPPTVPGSSIPPGADPPFAGPWLVKPRFGRGSRDIVPVDDPAELHAAIRHVPDPIVQHRLVGREFTVDALVAPDGTSLVGAVPRWRDETKAGISVRGETFVDGAVTAGVAGLLAALRLAGPSNVQGFVDPATGQVAFTEVNPRFSGGLPLSLAAGADLVGEYLRVIVGMAPRPERLVYRPGVRMFRYFAEIFEETGS